jgi:hypothetical protein
MCEVGCTRWGMPDSLVPETVGYHPNPRILGTVWSVSAQLGYRSVCLGLPCRVHESINCRPLTVIRDCLINWP